MMITLKRKPLTVILLTVICFVASAAPKLRTVKGTVVDEYNDGIPGAAVVVKDGTRGVITDVDGRFAIEVTDEDYLVVSYLGYEDETFKVGTQTELKIKMVPVANELDEVTVVAYGTQKKASVIGSISTIDSKGLASPVGQLSTSLAGKLAGVVSMQRTGEPGAGADFWIRGVNTFGANSTPLIIVDGVERSMDLVDVDDIASFSILKDATATALYGVRGANGIAIITTKRAMESKPKINIKAEHGFTQPVKLPSLANTSQWIDYYNELFIDSGAEPAISDYERQMYLSGADPDIYPSVDWVKTIFKNLASTDRVNMNVTGGSKTMRYYVGASYYKEDGIFNVAENTEHVGYDNQMRFDKFSFRANVDLDITKTTSLSLSLSTQYNTKTGPATNMGDLYAYTMYSTPIASPPIYSDGTLANPDGGYNPYRMLNSSGYTRTTNIVAQSLVTLTQKLDFITEGLKANIKYSWDAENGNVLTRVLNETFYFDRGRDDEGNIIYEPWNEGTGYMSLSRSNSSFTITNLEAGLNYERMFNSAHDVSAMLIVTNRVKYNNVPGNYLLAFPYKYLGLAGRATYSYKKRYFTEVNFGYNGSEQFAPGYRFGFFPSIAFGYLISNEKFWAPLKSVVQELKLKVSYGKSGNDQAASGTRYGYNPTINTSANGFTFGKYLNNYVGGITVGYPGNPHLHWEEASKFDAGFEIKLFDSLAIQADYFYDLRDGIILARQSTPGVMGTLVEMDGNIGKMQNQGVDMGLQYEKKFGDLYVSARANYTFNRNKRLYDDQAPLDWEYQNLTGFAQGQQFGLIAEGLFESQDDIDNWPRQDFGPVRPGDIKYRDVNGDGVVNTFDAVAIGYTTIPEINYGFGVSVGWKGFDASIFFQGVDHVTRIIGGQNLFGASSQIMKLGQIYEDVALNRWTLSNQNPNAPYPRLSLNKVENNQQASTYWQRDMSFIRLKNAEIGYTIPKKLTKKIGLSTVRIYGQGVNLLTFSKFKLWDPELNASYGNVYPTMRTFTFGAQLNF